MSDKSVPRRGPKGPILEADSPGAAERAVRIDALMALPIKQPANITVFGDDDVVGINPPPPGKT